jgi:Rad3-related DNA helicases
VQIPIMVKENRSDNKSKAADKDDMLDFKLVDGGMNVQTLEGVDKSKMPKRRKLVSVFSSNQAIHELTEKIVQSHDYYYSNRCEGKHNQQNEREMKIHDGSSRDINRDTNDNADGKDADDEVLLTESNLINPFVDYPHLRHFCGVYKFEEDPGKFCEKCFCKVCNIPAEKCVKWSEHCHACNKPEWELKRRQVLESNNVIVLDDDDDDGGDDDNDHNNGGNIAVHGNDDQTILDASNSHGNNTFRTTFDDGYHANSELRRAIHENDEFDDHDEFMNNYDHHFEQSDKDLIGQKSRKDARITDVLSHNLRQLTKLSIANSSTESRNRNVDTCQIQKMQGDIPQLNLHSSFFVEGVRIGWPYPVIMPPQRQMALHLIKAFKNERHVVIESPTGTG